MESVGEFFRQVRETKGLTIDEVASKTRIRTDFLKALEEGNFAKLPDQVFAKGFVRTYARSLGLDEEDAMRRFVQTAGAFYNKQEERERLRLKQAEDQRRKRANRKILALAFGVALLLVVLLLTRQQSGWLFSRPAPKPPPFAVHTPPAVVPSPSEPTPSKAEIAGPVGPGPRSLSGPGAMGQPGPTIPVEPLPQGPEDMAEMSSPPAVLAGPPAGQPVTPVAVEPLVLDLEALELTWVVVQVDGGLPHEALLRPGERVRWKGDKQFTLTLGNAGGVRVELNGEPKGPFGPSGSVARGIVLKRKG